MADNDEIALSIKQFPNLFCERSCEPLRSVLPLQGSFTPRNAAEIGCTEKSVQAPHSASKVWQGSRPHDVMSGDVDVMLAQSDAIKDNDGMPHHTKRSIDGNESFFSSGRARRRSKQTRWNYSVRKGCSVRQSLVFNL